MSRRLARIPGLAALCLSALGGSAAAQSLAVTPAWVTGGYNGAAAAVTTAFDPSTRDANGNRVVNNGEIVTPGVASVADSFAAMAAGAGVYSAGAGAGASISATAIGNVNQIQVQGSWNTVIASVAQTNTGPVTATVASK